MLQPCTIKLNLRGTTCMIRATTTNGEIKHTEIFSSNNNCIVHFLDLNVNQTKAYLKSAWTAGSTGASDFYLAHVEDNDQLAYLNFSQIFDFQRILIVTFSGVLCSSSFQYTLDVISPCITITEKCSKDHATQ